jgi:hypothetical protein
MTKMTLKQLDDARDAARATYAQAFEAFRSAYARLHAYENMLAARGLGSPGFGNIPDITIFRHGVANPDIIGTLQTDIGNIVAGLEIVEAEGQTEVGGPSPFATR